MRVGEELVFPGGEEGMRNQHYKTSAYSVLFTYCK